MLSSHLVSDVELACDHLIVLVGSRVQIAGEIRDLLTTHYRLTGPRRDTAAPPAGGQVIAADHTDRQTTLLMRTDTPVQDPAWTVSRPSLEDLVLAYMAQNMPRTRRPRAEVHR